MSCERLFAQIQYSITMMFANNEVGPIQPIREIGELARQHDILFHTDAVSGVGHPKHLLLKIYRWI